MFPRIREFSRRNIALQLIVSYKIRLYHHPNWVSTVSDRLALLPCGIVVERSLVVDTHTDV